MPAPVPIGIAVAAKKADAEERASHLGNWASSRDVGKPGDMASADLFGNTNAHPNGKRAAIQRCDREWEGC